MAAKKDQDTISFPYFSRAPHHTLGTEGDRVISFRCVIDGRERQPTEPVWRRNEGGDILGDLAILRSFQYPQVNLNAFGAFKQFTGLDKNAEYYSAFQQPPTALLVLGDRTVEGFITHLEITETLFNAELAPIRAEVSIKLTEKVDSVTFVLESIKRLTRAASGSVRGLAGLG